MAKQQSKKQPKFTRTGQEISEYRNGRLKRLLDKIREMNPDYLRPPKDSNGKAQDILDLIRKRQQGSDDDLE